MATSVSIRNRQQLAQAIHRSGMPVTLQIEDGGKAEITYRINRSTVDISAATDTHAIHHVGGESEVLDVAIYENVLHGRSPQKFSEPITIAFSMLEERGILDKPLTDCPSCGGTRKEAKGQLCALCAGSGAIMRDQPTIAVDLNAMRRIVQLLRNMPGLGGMFIDCGPIHSEEPAVNMHHLVRNIETVQHSARRTYADLDSTRKELRQMREDVGGLGRVLMTALKPELDEYFKFSEEVD